MYLLASKHQIQEQYEVYHKRGFPEMKVPTKSMIYLNLFHEKSAEHTDVLGVPHDIGNLHVGLKPQ